jgi:hypothetical protein
MLRALLMAALAIALWRAVRSASAAMVTRASTVRELPPVMREASRDARIGALDVRVDSAPAARERDWLAALSRAGVAVRWQGGPPVLALDVRRTPEPESRVRLLVVADSSVPWAITDSAGALDSVRVLGGRGVLESPLVVGRAMVHRGRWQASAAVPREPAPRAVLVLGRVSWESKFVAAALQETGWTVRTRAPAAPGVVVSDAALLPIDTSRYAAAIALDSTAADLAPALARFVAQGGGLVLAGSAPHVVVLRALAPANTAARRPGRILLAGDSVTRADLAVRPLIAIRADAVRLEGTDAEPAVVVRRAGLGRVLTLRYDDSWQWRMLGGASGLAAHERWWSHIVSAVAPDADTTAATAQEGAPLAALVAAVGPAIPATAASASSESAPLPLILLMAIVLTLLAETASRRFRGAR